MKKEWKLVIMNVIINYFLLIKTTKLLSSDKNKTGRVIKITGLLKSNGETDDDIDDEVKAVEDACVVDESPVVIDEVKEELGVGVTN